MSRIFALTISLLLLSPSLPTWAERTFPPVPSWQPTFSASNDQILDSMIYYSNNRVDLVVFKHGTTVILPSGLSDDEAIEYSFEILSKIISFHPDFRPTKMDDGNMLISYNHPAYNVVIEQFAQEHLEAIRRHHLDALAKDEVLVTNLGQNKFDEFGMKALYGRTFMFMDAQHPIIDRIYRYEDEESK